MGATLSWTSSREKVHGPFRINYEVICNYYRRELKERQLPKNIVVNTPDIIPNGPLPR